MKSRNLSGMPFIGVQRMNFTLIELLIVISIVAILTGILLPALKSARDMALSIQCVNQLRENLFSFTSYANDFNGWMVVDSTSGTDKWPQIMSGKRGSVPCGDYLKLGKNKRRILCPATTQTLANNNGITGNGNYYKGYGIQTPNTSSSYYLNTHPSRKNQTA